MTFRKLVELALEVDGPRFLTEASLIQILRVQPELSEKLYGEVLLRLWLCRHTRANPDLDAILMRRRLVSSVVDWSALGDQEWKKLLTRIQAVAPTAAEYAKRHINWFNRCHGMIAVVIDEEEAFPIPMIITPPHVHGGSVRDFSDRSIPDWCERMTSIFHACGTEFGIQLLISAGSRADVLFGGSFGFAACAARASEIGKLPKFPATKLLVTGEIRGNGVEQVRSLELKEKLANRMGAKFYSPDALSESLVPDGQLLEPVMERLAEFIKSSGLAKLTPRETLNALKKLQSDLHSGKIDSAAAECQVGFLLDNLYPGDTQKIVVEARIYGEVIRASAANHLGDPNKAHDHLHCANDLAKGCSNPLLYVHALANEVVALTDATDFPVAEQLGRDLLAFVELEFKGSAEDELIARMTACGVLGGQPLLQLGMRTSKKAEESRVLIDKSLESAKKFESQQEICRGLTQLALWHALNQPVNYQSSHQRAETYFSGVGENASISTAYLRNYRLLASRRRVLFGDGALEEGFASWLLPDRHVGEMGWIYATACKYRATLFAKSNQPDRAISDFEEGLEILNSCVSPLLKFIRSTILAEWLLASQITAVKCPWNIGELLQKLEMCDHPEATRWHEKLSNGQIDALFELVQFQRY